MIVMTLSAGSLARAQEPNRTTGNSEAEHVMRLTPAELTWTAGPPMLPPGVRMALIEGAPHQPGPFTFRLKFPPDYKIPAHWHPTKVTVTVISGTFNMGLGDELDTAKGKKDAPGREHLRDAGTDPSFRLDDQGRDDHSGAWDRAFEDAVPEPGGRSAAQIGRCA